MSLITSPGVSACAGTVLRARTEETANIVNRIIVVLLSKAEHFSRNTVERTSVPIVILPLLHGAEGRGAGHALGNSCWPQLMIDVCCGVPLTGNQMVTYPEDERRRRFPGLGGCEPPPTAGPAAREEWPDIRRAMPGTGHDAPSGREASVNSGGSEPRVVEATGARKASLHQSRADQRDCRALDWQVRAATLARTLGTQEEAGRRKQ